LRYELLADDFAGLLDHLGLAQADLFGYSLGAAVAMQVAIRHPGRVRRLACMSVTYRSAGMHPEMGEAVDVDTSIEELEDGPYQRAYQAVAPDPARWPVSRLAVIPGLPISACLTARPGSFRWLPSSSMRLSHPAPGRLRPKLARS
jgi:pimeloyl-ACP methyl ester carboxylesterase